jgi:hypothetical protein
MASSRDPMEIVQAEILMSGVDDWLHIPEVLSFVREAFPETDEPQALPLAIRAIEELLSQGLVEVGEIVDHEFVPWPGTVDEVKSRIDGAARKACFPISFGDLFWVRNTPRGTERGDALLDRSDS